MVFLRIVSCTCLLICFADFGRCVALAFGRHRYAPLYEVYEIAYPKAMYYFFPLFALQIKLLTWYRLWRKQSRQGYICGNCAMLVLLAIISVFTSQLIVLPGFFGAPSYLMVIILMVMMANAENPGWGNDHDSDQGPDPCDDPEGGRRRCAVSWG